ncbi:MAG: hypothetical protein FJY88_08900 [Candidatus Eisenbacteria bacterium]|nr:hypothetical protein [Candidatus Eisenbacteria bacterium]
MRASSSEPPTSNRRETGSEDRTIAKIARAWFTTIRRMTLGVVRWSSVGGIPVGIRLRKPRRTSA